MIECENIKIEIDKKLILNDVSFKIKSGEKLLITGESGSGKTSLIRTLLFFENFNGTIKYDGEKIGIENIEKYRSHIGYIGQKIPAFNQNVESFLKIQNNFKANENKKFEADRMLDLLGKLNFEKSILKTKFNNLSGGEKQRIAVIGVLLLNKPIYIFDEITSALDKKNIDSLISVIMQETNTIISVSHNKEWERYCSRIIKMERGEIIDDRLV